ncbi:MAG: META domain-containing protein [Anaerolineae bacterium]|nr:META domain-containing protein [Anaerolineae bacterium]
MKKLTSVLLLLTILLLAACGGREEETPTAVPTVEIPTLAPVSTATPIPEVGAENAAALQATPWKWVSYLDQATGQTSISDPQNYVVIFQPDGSVQVKADCNNAAGTYTTSGDSLTISFGAVTLAACPDGSRSEQFLMLLSSAAKYTIADLQLRIDLMADGGSLTLIPEAVMPPSTSTPTPLPPVEVQPTAVPPSGSSVDSGPREHAMGTYAAPYYTVAAGDTLYSIGLRFGLTTDQLIAANPASANGIYTGQLLIIPTGGVPVPPIAPTSAPPAPTYERVTFAPGAISTTLNGSIDYNQPKGYVIYALAGQTMQISTVSSAEYLNIMVQSSDGTVLPLNGVNNQAQNTVSLLLPYTGDFIVTVSPLSPPESPSLNFTITFVIQ